MIDNIGGKIKSMATVLVWLGVIGGILLGLIMMFSNFFVGLLYMVIGVFSSVLGSFLVYGFGQLIENSDILVKAAKLQHPQLEPAPEVYYEAPKYQNPQPVPNYPPWICVSCCVRRPCSAGIPQTMVH